MSDKEKRLLWADSLKGILILIVILDHAIQYVEGDACFHNRLWNITSSFYLPAFMAVSGWLSFRPDKSSQVPLLLIKRRFQQLLVPFFIWFFLKLARIGNLSIIGIWATLKVPDGSFWFLWALFFIFVIFVLSIWAGKLLRCGETTSLLTASLILMGIMVIFEVRVFGFQLIAYYFLYYVIGFFFHKYKNFLCNNYILNICIFVLWLFLAWFWNMHDLPSWMPKLPYLPESVVQYAYRGLTALSILYVIFNYYPSIGESRNKFNIKLASLGQITLGIYVVHLMVMLELKPAINYLKAEMNSILLEIAVFAVTFVISVVIVMLLRRNKITNKYLLGKV